MDAIKCQTYAPASLQLWRNLHLFRRPTAQGSENAGALHRVTMRHTRTARPAFLMLRLADILPGTTLVSVIHRQTLANLPHQLPLSLRWRAPVLPLTRNHGTVRSVWPFPLLARTRAHGRLAAALAPRIPMPNAHVRH